MCVCVLRPVAHPSPTFPCFYFICPACALALARTRLLQVLPVLSLSRSQCVFCFAPAFALGHNTHRSIPDFCCCSFSRPVIDVALATRPPRSRSPKSSGRQPKPQPNIRISLCPSSLQPVCVWVCVCPTRSHRYGIYGTCMCAKSTLGSYISTCLGVVLSLHAF